MPSPDSSASRAAWTVPKVERRPRSTSSGDHGRPSARSSRTVSSPRRTRPRYAASWTVARSAHGAAYEPYTSPSPSRSTASRSSRYFGSGKRWFRGSGKPWRSCDQKRIGRSIAARAPVRGGADQPAPSARCALPPSGPRCAHDRFADHLPPRGDQPRRDRPREAVGAGLEARAARPRRRRARRRASRGRRVAERRDRRRRPVRADRRGRRVAAGAHRRVRRHRDRPEGEGPPALPAPRPSAAPPGGVGHELRGSRARVRGPGGNALRPADARRGVAAHHRHRHLMPSTITKGTAAWSTASPPTSPWPASPASPEIRRRPRHTGPVATRVTSSRMVGRTAELQQLEDALRDASSGRPSLAFVAGESGVGKTRLVSELLRRAEAAGAHVLSGEAVELGEGEVPYAALMAALRPLSRDGHPSLDALHPHDRAELARLLPGLAGAAPGDDSPDTPAQGRLFEAVLALLDRLGSEAPVVLALEDLHWADPSTRAFVAFLAHSLCRERVLVVLTYRLDEMHRRHPLRPLLAEIERDPSVRRITVQRLTRDELAAALEDILAAAPAGDLVERLYARSEGNPLFMEELLAAGVDGRGALPENLRDALMVRFEQLGDPAQEVLRVLAVGQRVDHALVAEVSGMDRTTLVAALREAVASHFVVAADDDRYAFRHALLREVVVDDLLPGERTELHHAFAVALERRPADGPAGAQVAAGVAHHYAAAGDQRAALRASVRAATAAESVHAFGEAAALLERALELWDRVPDAAEVAGVDQVELLHRAGDAFIAAGDRSRPTPLLRAALEMIDAAEDPRRAAAVLERLAMAHWRANRAREAIDTAERALELVADGEPTPERATIHAWFAKIRMLQGRYRDATVAAREAIAAAEATGNHAALSSALNGMGLSLAAQGAVEEGVAALRRAVEIAQESNRPRELESAQVNLSDALHIAGRTREALEVIREARRQAPIRAHAGAWLDMAMSEFLLELGDWDEAQRLLPDESRRFAGNELVNLEMRRAELHLGRGEHDDAAARLARLADPVAASSEPQWHGGYGSLLAELRRRQGDLDGARAAVDDALDRIEFCTEDASRLARVSAAGVTVEADRAERGRDLGDDAEVQRAVGDIQSYALRVEAAAEVSGLPVEAAWLQTARADSARAAGEPSAELWAESAEAWRAIERPYRVALAQWRAAEALVAADDREAAAAVAAAALETAHRLGAGWLAGEVEGLIARARLRMGDGAAANGADGADGAEGAGAAGPGGPVGPTPRRRPGGAP